MGLQTIEEQRQKTQCAPQGTHQVEAFRFQVYTSVKEATISPVW